MIRKDIESVNVLLMNLNFIFMCDIIFVFVVGIFCFYLDVN